MRYKLLIKTILYTLLTICSTTLIYASEKPTYSLSFSSQANNGIPINSVQTEFDCSNQVFTIIEAENLGTQIIQSTLIWRNPQGEIQEQTRLSFGPVEGKAKSWAWIKLHQEGGAALFSFIDPSAGMGDFIGDWEIELLVNNKSVAKSSFNILC